ncbi:MAG: ThuA domain-containing protein [Pirellulales bacterium]|nr:ThuA domain-containing protein [Pirellulales bacterium]
MWRFFLFSMTILGIWSISAFSAEQAANQPVTEETPIRVLVVTGVDYPGHPWKQTGPALRDLVEQDKRFDTRIIEDPEFLASDRLFDYDVVILHFKNYEPFKHEAKVRENLESFVKNGKGLMLLHFACGAFPNWPEFEQLAGKVWDEAMTGGYHDPRGPFSIQIVNKEHPITRGMNDLAADDELYFCLKGTRDVEVLATARSKITGKDHPMAFIFEYGTGRVFHTPLGHDVKAIQMPGVAELLRRATAWSAGRNP